MKPQPKVALFIFRPLGRLFHAQRLGPEFLPHNQSQRPKLLAFLAAVAEGDTETRIPVDVVALRILVIEARKAPLFHLMADDTWTAQICAGPGEQGAPGD